MHIAKYKETQVPHVEWQVPYLEWKVPFIECRHEQDLGLGLDVPASLGLGLA